MTRMGHLDYMDPEVGTTLLVSIVILLAVPIPTAMPVSVPILIAIFVSVPILIAIPVAVPIIIAILVAVPIPIVIIVSIPILIAIPAAYIYIYTLLYRRSIIYIFLDVIKNW